jgi:hypothetical protein
MLTNGILNSGQLPFLHFSHENTPAKRLYERIGFSFRADIPLLVVTRDGQSPEPKPNPATQTSP